MYMHTVVVVGGVPVYMHAGCVGGVYLSVYMHTSKEPPELCCGHVGRRMESKILRLSVSLMFPNLCLDTVTAGKAEQLWKTFPKWLKPL